MQKIYLLVISIFSIIQILFGTAAAGICSIEITALRARDDGCDQCGLTVGTMARSWVCNTPSKRKFHVTELEVGIRFVSWAMQKRDPFCLVYMGDEIVPSCVGTIVNHEIRIPIKPTRIQWKVRPGLFRGSVVQQLRPHHNTLTILEELVGSSQNFSVSKISHSSFFLRSIPSALIPFFLVNSDSCQRFGRYPGQHATGFLLHFVSISSSTVWAAVRRGTQGSCFFFVFFLGRIEIWNPPSDDGNMMINYMIDPEKLQ